jgi:DNA-binding beta-propeller fold protein YncE
LVADLSAWFRANPVARPTPLDADPEGLPFSMAAVGSELWVVDAAAEQIVRVTQEGVIARLVDLSTARIGPMAIVPAPEGGAYVAAMGSAPFGPRTGKVVLVSPAGAVSDVWTGLTAPVGVAVDDAGTLYALETSTNNSPTPPYVSPRAGRLVRQAGVDGRDVLVKRLNLPTALATGPDGALYVAVRAEDDGTGAILRIAPGVGEELVAPSGELVGPVCEESATGSPPRRSARPTG